MKALWRHKLDNRHQWSCFLLLDINVGQRWQKHYKPTIFWKYVTQTPNDKIGWQNFYSSVILKGKWYVAIPHQMSPYFLMFSPLYPSPLLQCWHLKHWRAFGRKKQSTNNENGGRGASLLYPLNEWHFDFKFSLYSWSFANNFVVGCRYLECYVWRCVWIFQEKLKV